MVFHVSPRRGLIATLRPGLTGFRQTTALIGATLLFCLAGAGADARVLYYNFGQTGQEPDPDTGGVWSTDGADDNWVASPNGGGNWPSSNTVFGQGPGQPDDAHFLTDGNGVIEVEVDGVIEAGDIVVEDGAFVLNDDDPQTAELDAVSLAIDAAGNLTSNVDLDVSEGVDVQGTLTIGAGSTLDNSGTASTGVDVSGTGELIVDGTIIGAVSVDDTASLTVDGIIDGSVTVGADASLDIGSGGVIEDTLIFDGTTYNGGGHVGALTVRAGSDVSFHGVTAVVDRLVSNAGNLTLGEGSFSGGLLNELNLTLTDDVEFGTTQTRDGRNEDGGLIRAQGGNHTLSFTGNFINGGTLDGGNAGSSLTIDATQITLQSTAVIQGDVTLSGAIINAITLDMVHVPVLAGSFTNTVGGTANVTTNVDGNGQDLTNNGTLDVSGGNLTGLDSLTNGNAATNGIINVAANRTLGATTITHERGTFVSLGTLEGAVTTRGTASIQGVIDGSLTVEASTTTITGDLDLSTSTGGGLITVGSGGRLTIADTMEVTTARLLNEGRTDLGATGVTINGDVENSGLMTGIGTVTGNLTLSGDARYTGSSLTVDGVLITNLDDPANLGNFAGIAFDQLSNLATLTINQAVTADVANQASGTMTVAAAITGDLTSRGTTTLRSDVNGDVRVMAGTTTIGANTAGGGPVLVGTAGGADLEIGQNGALLLTGGSLTSATNVDAQGQIRVLRAHTLTTPQLVVSSDAADQSLIRGTVAGAVSVADGGDLTLDGAIITGLLTNDGTLGSPTVSDRATQLQNGLVNNGEIDLTARAQTVVITGVLRNNAGAVAVINGDVIAGAGRDGNVINRGQLTLNGDVAGSVNNTRTLVLDGSIGSNLLNSGTATVGGTIAGDAINSGTLNLGADVALEIRNSGTLNISGDSQATNLVNSGTVNVNAGQSLDLTSGVLENVADATLNIFGTVETSAGSGVLDLRNREDGILNLASSGTIAGDLTNAGSASLAGSVTGDVRNNPSGDLLLSDGAEIAGRLANRGTATVAAAATVTVEGGTFNRADGTLDVVGRLVSDVTNAADGLINIDGGTIEGDVRNAAGGNIVSSGWIVGDVTNNGTFTVDGSGHVDGSFTNNGELDQSVGGSTLIVTDRLINNGVIDDNGLGTFTISAGLYENNGTLRGDVDVTGDILNTGLIDYDADAALNANLTNADTGEFLVDVTVTGTGDNLIVNEGLIDIGEDGALVNIDTIVNREQLTIALGGELQANAVVNAAGTLTNDGRIEADVLNRAGAELISTRTIVGDVQNSGDATLGGRVVGTLATGEGGTTTIEDELDVTGLIQNEGDLTVADGATLIARRTIQNLEGGTLTADGAIEGSIRNAGLAIISGGLTGDLTNEGEARLSGSISGLLLNNSDDATVRIRDNLTVETLLNNAGRLTVGRDNVLTVEGQFQNTGSGELTIAGEVNLQSADEPLLNASSNGMTMLASATLNGDLQNDSTATLAGTINGDVVNNGGTVTTGGNLLVDGVFINQRGVAAGGASEPQLGPGDPARLLVNAGDTMTVIEGVYNDEFSVVQVDGVLAGRVVNDGEFNLTNRLRGTLDTSGEANLEGVITRDVIFRDGTINLTGDLQVLGTFEADADLTVGADRTLTANLYRNRVGQVLTLEGAIAGTLENLGTIVAADGARVENMTNDGTVTMADGTAGDVLTVTGDLDGEGIYELDLDMSANGGEGASDVVVVSGGAVTGSILLSFDSGDITTPSNESRRILVFDVDGSEANNFEFGAEGLPAASERIIYSLVRDEATGDLYISDEINPALGALAGNLALTQSLIGSVVNRPTSPFVPGLAVDAGDKKCGIGGWARAVAGRASATGQTSNETRSVASSIEASYRGMQFGGDLACFEGSVSGWNVAFGALGGINDGTTTQPVYVNDATNPSELTSVLGSINHGDFRQMYAGVYATASRDQLSLDLQVRRERTKFTIDNEAIGEDNDGLQLSNSDFDSNAVTVSGSVSYAYQLPREGWMFVPTAGFAFTNLSVDEIGFTSGDKLQIKDSKNRVGFIGGTISKTFINEGNNSAIHAFGTATIYKDFAPDTSSIYTMVGTDGSVIRTEELSSSSLGTYGELSLGANYLKVLDSGSAHAPRQFNASIRVDGRTGDVLDSVGVTAQVRFQF